jgi:hypothetical protein
MHSFGVSYATAFLGAFAVGAVVTALVTVRFGQLGRLIMVLPVPLLSLFGVWPLAQALGPNRGCDYDCEGNALFGILMYVGLVLGIIIATVVTWAMGVTDEYPGERSELPELPRGYDAPKSDDTRE